jgi:hypothetical protein
VKAKASGLAFHFVDAARVSVAAMRAYRTIRPKTALDICESNFLVEKLGGVES